MSQPTTCLFGGTMLLVSGQSADGIHRRLRRIRLEHGNLDDRERPQIGLRMVFSESVPGIALGELRFDLIIEVPEVVHETGEMRIGYRGPSFVVSDATICCGARPSCLLELRPAPQRGPKDACHRTTFLTLADEAAQYVRRNGTRRDWRHHVAGIRFYHPLHRTGKMYARKNPDYEPMPVVHASTIWDAPARGLQTEDQGTLDDWLKGLGEGFDDREAGGPSFAAVLPKTGS